MSRLNEPGRPRAQEFTAVFDRQAALKAESLLASQLSKWAVLGGLPAHRRVTLVSHF
jgi:hypothetical protein